DVKLIRDYCSIPRSVMTGTKKRHSAAFKDRVALEAAKQTRTLAELSGTFQVHSVQIPRPLPASQGSAPRKNLAAGSLAASRHRNPVTTFPFRLIQGLVGTLEYGGNPHPFTFAGGGDPEADGE